MGYLRFDDLQPEARTPYEADYTELQKRYPNYQWLLVTDDATGNISGWMPYSASAAGAMLDTAKQDIVPTLGAMAGAGGGKSLLGKIARGFAGGIIADKAQSAADLVTPEDRERYMQHMAAHPVASAAGRFLPDLALSAGGQMFSGGEKKVAARLAAHEIPGVNAIAVAADVVDLAKGATRAVQREAKLQAYRTALRQMANKKAMIAAGIGGGVEGLVEGMANPVAKDAEGNPISDSRFDPAALATAAVMGAGGVRANALGRAVENIGDKIHPLSAIGAGVRKVAPGGKTPTGKTPAGKPVGGSQPTGPKSVLYMAGEPQHVDSLYQVVGDEAAYKAKMGEIAGKEGVKDFDPEKINWEALRTRTKAAYSAKMEASGVKTPGGKEAAPVDETPLAGFKPSKNAKPVEELSDLDKQWVTKVKNMAPEEWRAYVGEIKDGTRAQALDLVQVGARKIDDLEDILKALRRETLTGRNAHYNDAIDTMTDKAGVSGLRKYAPRAEGIKPDFSNYETQQTKNFGTDTKRLVSESDPRVINRNFKSQSVDVAHMDEIKKQLEASMRVRTGKVGDIPTKVNDVREQGLIAAATRMNFGPEDLRVLKATLDAIPDEAQVARYVNDLLSVGDTGHHVTVGAGTSTKSALKTFGSQEHAARLQDWREQKALHQGFDNPQAQTFRYVPNTVALRRVEDFGGKTADVRKALGAVPETPPVKEEIASAPASSVKTPTEVGAQTAVAEAKPTAEVKGGADVVAPVEAGKVAEAPVAETPASLRKEAADLRKIGQPDDIKAADAMEARAAKLEAEAKTEAPPAETPAAEPTPEPPAKASPETEEALQRLRDMGIPVDTGKPVAGGKPSKLPSAGGAAMWIGPALGILALAGMGDQEAEAGGMSQTAKGLAEAFGDLASNLGRKMVSPHIRQVKHLDSVVKAATVAEQAQHLAHASGVSRAVESARMEGLVTKEGLVKALEGEQARLRLTTQSAEDQLRALELAGEALNRGEIWVPGDLTDQQARAYLRRATLSDLREGVPLEQQTEATARVLPEDEESLMKDILEGNEIPEQQPLSKAAAREQAIMPQEATSHGRRKIELSKFVSGANDVEKAKKLISDWQKVLEERLAVAAHAEVYNNKFEDLLNSPVGERLLRDVNDMSAGDAVRHVSGTMESLYKGVKALEDVSAKGTGLRYADVAPRYLAEIPNNEMHSVLQGPLAHRNPIRVRQALLYGDTKSAGIEWNRLAYNRTIEEAEKHRELYLTGRYGDQASVYTDQVLPGLAGRLRRLNEEYAILRAAQRAISAREHTPVDANKIVEQIKRLNKEPEFYQEIGLVERQGPVGEKTSAYRELPISRSLARGRDIVASGVIPTAPDAGTSVSARSIASGERRFAAAQSATTVFGGRTVTTLEEVQKYRDQLRTFRDKFAAETKPPKEGKPQSGGLSYRERLVVLKDLDDQLERANKVIHHSVVEHLPTQAVTFPEIRNVREVLRDSLQVPRFLEDPASSGADLGELSLLENYEPLHLFHQDFHPGIRQRIADDVLSMTLDREGNPINLEDVEFGFSPHDNPTRPINRNDFVNRLTEAAETARHAADLAASINEWSYVQRAMDPNSSIVYSDATIRQTDRRAMILERLADMLGKFTDVDAVRFRSSVGSNREAFDELVRAAVTGKETPLETSRQADEVVNAVRRRFRKLTKDLPEPTVNVDDIVTRVDQMVRKQLGPELDQQLNTADFAAEVIERRRMEAGVEPGEEITEAAFKKTSVAHAQRRVIADWGQEFKNVPEVTLRQSAQILRDGALALQRNIEKAQFSMSAVGLKLSDDLEKEAYSLLRKGMDVDEVLKTIKGDPKMEAQYEQLRANHMALLDQAALFNRRANMLEEVGMARHWATRKEPVMVTERMQMDNPERSRLISEMQRFGWGRDIPQKRWLEWRQHKADYGKLVGQSMDGNEVDVHAAPWLVGDAFHGTGDLTDNVFSRLRGGNYRTQVYGFLRELSQVDPTLHGRYIRSSDPFQRAFMRWLAPAKNELIKEEIILRGLSNVPGPKMGTALELTKELADYRINQLMRAASAAESEVVSLRKGIDKLIERFGGQPRDQQAAAALMSAETALARADGRRYNAQRRMIAWAVLVPDSKQLQQALANQKPLEEGMLMNLGEMGRGNSLEAQRLREELANKPTYVKETALEQAINRVLIENRKPRIR